jgi:hypothetical protein
MKIYFLRYFSELKGIKGDLGEMRIELKLMLSQSNTDHTI